MNEHSANAFIAKLNRFVPLSDADKAVLAQISEKPRFFAPRTDLVNEGDVPTGFLVVLSGFACRYKLRVNGARHIVAYLVPGDPSDLDVTFPGRMDHSIGTLSPCTVAWIEPAVIEDLLKHRPQIAKALRMNAMVNEATLRQWLVNIGCRSAIERIAHLFCELFFRLHVVGMVREEGFDLPLTQIDLAETKGISNVHVNRTLRALQKTGFIDYKRSRIRILDWHGLTSIAEFNNDYLYLEQASS